MAAPSFVAQTTLTPNTTTSFTVTPPSQATGRGVIVAGTAGFSATVTPPAGWTTVLALAATTGSVQSKFYVFYRIIQAGDATTWTFTGSTNGTAAFSCDVYDGVTSVEATTSNSNNGGSAATSWAGPTLTAGSAGPYRLVHCVGAGFGTGAANETLDAALSARSSVAAANFWAMAVSDEVVSAGATTARTTTSTNSQQWASAILLLVGSTASGSLTLGGSVGGRAQGASAGSVTLGGTVVAPVQSHGSLTLGSPAAAAHPVYLASFTVDVGQESSDIPTLPADIPTADYVGNDDSDLVDYPDPVLDGWGRPIAS